MTAFLFLIFNHISVLSQNINLHINFSCEQTEKDKLPGQHTCVMSRLTGARQLVCKEHSHRVQYLNLTSYHHFFSSVVTSFLRRAQHLVSEGEDRKRKAQQVWRATRAIKSTDRDRKEYTFWRGQRSSTNLTRVSFSRDRSDSQESCELWMKSQETDSRWIVD